MKICFFGDSICFGQFISPCDTWVVRLSLLISQKFKNRGITVINASVNGNTTRQALERMPYDIQSHKEIDIIYVQFGMNDCNYWLTDQGHPRVSIKAFEANLFEIIERSKIFGARKILLGTNHPTTKVDLFPHLHQSYQSSNKEYNEVIRKVSREASITLIDHEKEWLKQIERGVLLDNLLLPDRIHLSLTGHQIYLDFLYHTLSELVQELLQC